MGRLILISNRLPVRPQKVDGTIVLHQSPGGLATGLWPMHKSGEGIWIGSLGEDVQASRPSRRVLEALRRERLVPVQLPPEVINGYYKGFANSVLWPLLHHFPALMVVERGWWEAYREANRRFVVAVARRFRAGDTIWVHDYHLLLLPAILRRRLPDARIGFFLHTPFPSSEVFRVLPWRHELLSGMLGADLVGFQVYDSLRHFRSSAQRVLGLDGEVDWLALEGRCVKLGVFPIGIDPERFRRTVEDEQETKTEVNRLHQELRGRHLILGVDRMDYTKGIPERLLGYERFLERFPTWHGRVEFLQIGVPSRTDVARYRELRRRVEEIVGRVQGRFGTPDWVPVKYMFRPVPFDRLCALYRAARVALVTPLRDGMNLVAKEYVACQRGGDGVLVLSEFAGASAELSEAIQVNPYDPEMVSTAIHQALTLPRGERVARMGELARRVWVGNVSQWAARFVHALHESGASKEWFPPRLVGARREEMLSAWRDARTRLMVLDYDGTLRVFVSRPELARPDRALLLMLQRLSRIDGVDLAIVSGRDPVTLEQWFGSIPLTLAAEHGRWLRRVGGTWEDMLSGRVPAWLDPVRSILEEASASTPGSFVEVKSASVAWHYRNSNAELAGLRLRELTQHLRDLHVDPPLDLLAGNKVLEVRILGVSKASVLVTLLTGREPIDLLLAAGDDATDEELFAQMPPSAWSILVGSRPSRARTSLADVRALRALLTDLARAAGS